MARKLCIILAILVTFFSPLMAGPQNESVTLPSAVPAGREPDLDGDSLGESLRRLSSPEMEGRLTGSAGNARAGRWLAEELSKAGLKPLPGRGDFYLPYPQPVLRERTPSVVEIFPKGSGAGTSLSAGVDYQVLVRKGVRLRADIEARVVTLEASSVSPGWVRENRDAVLLIHARDFEAIVHNTPVMQALFHEEHSPRGIILAMPAGMNSLPRGVFLTEESYPEVGPVFIQVSHRASEVFSQGEGTRVRISVHQEVAVQEAVNIGGAIPGGDGDLPPIILSAHFDGQGRLGSEVLYPGAIDNASGTALVLELARSLSENRAGVGKSSGNDLPSRPVWILFFNGEEQGLLGSRAFAGALAGRAGPGVWVVNIDMVAHSNKTALTLASAPGSGELLRELTAALTPPLADLSMALNTMEGGLSDHGSFGSESPVPGSQAVTLVQAPYPGMHSPQDIPGNLKPGVARALFLALVQWMNQ
ncbi:M28 family metallopeptidase [Spirochaeta lutea]|uniref:Peptidase M28 domain-containing protein n=1 Tax=Spirochaeta lutea TaxID=1480694 RepID=A0A098QU71_9SPIO|nr:M28 family peptidase [Spirochaeta lutea]KGE70933.1 hypothetical protein DC28_13400 [Spirochaeta lutea]